METILRGLQWSECLLYLDDVISFGDGFDLILERLRRVFQHLINAGLKLKPRKCAFFCKEVEFLGHIVSSEGVKVRP